jgi:hypothetical protein
MADTQPPIQTEARRLSTWLRCWLRGPHGGYRAELLLTVLRDELAQLRYTLEADDRYEVLEQARG